MGPFLVITAARMVGAAMTENEQQVREKVLRAYQEQLEESEHQIREEVWKELLEQFAEIGGRIRGEARVELLEELAKQLAENGQGVREVELSEQPSAEHRIRGEARAELLEQLAEQLAKNAQEIRKVELPEGDEYGQTDTAAEKQEIGWGTPKQVVIRLFVFFLVVGLTLYMCSG